MKTIEKFRDLSDDAWLQMLIRSIDVPVVDDLKMPRFPSDEVQSQFVGSSRLDALREGAAFYKLTQTYANLRHAAWAPNIFGSECSRFRMWLGSVSTFPLEGCGRK